MRRFFLETEITGEEARITGGDARHIRDVLRMGPGGELTLCGPSGREHLCRIAEIGKKEVLLSVLEEIQGAAEPDMRVTLFQGLPKGDKFEFIIEKAVELGVFEIIPVAAERSVPVLGEKAEKKSERWNKIAMAAAKQCGRGRVPRVGPVLRFRDAIDLASAMDLAIIPYEKEKSRGLREAISGFAGSSAAVIIGPEGGFAPEEISLAEEKGVLPVTLGPRILRTETAGLFALSAMGYELMI